MIPLRRLCLTLAVSLLLLPVSAAAGVSLTLEDPSNGKTVKLKHGAAALHVVFFATWCHPCVEELDRLATLEARWSERGYELVLIGVPNRQSNERLKSFLDDRSPPGRLLFDADGSAQKALGAEHLPTHILFDAGGREVLRAERANDGMDAAIDALFLGDDP